MATPQRNLAPRSRQVKREGKNSSRINNQNNTDSARAITLYLPSLHDYIYTYFN